MNYLIYINDKQDGPYDKSEILEKLRNGFISGETFAWCEGMSEWTAIREISELNASVQTLPQFVPSRAVNPAVNIYTETSSVSFWFVFLLSVFLGLFGAHRFYLKNKFAWVQLFTLGGCGVWSFIDMILILTGNMKDQNGFKIPNNHLFISWILFVIIGLPPCMGLFSGLLMGSVKKNNKLASSIEATNQKKDSKEVIIKSSPEEDLRASRKFCLKRIEDNIGPVLQTVYHGESGGIYAYKIMAQSSKYNLTVVLEICVSKNTNGEWEVVDIHSETLR